MHVELLNTKGKKNDPGACITKQFHLSDKNVTDPTKLLLVHAMRCGAIEERSWNELLEVLRKRNTHTVKWTRPADPVIYSRHRGHTNLDFSKPGGVQGQSSTLQGAARRIGVLGRITSNSIRRGPGKDGPHFQGGLLGTNLDFARLVMIHDDDMNGTKGSIGEICTDDWQARHQVKYIQGDLVKIAASPFPMDSQKRRAVGVIRAKAEADGLDYTDTTHRNKAPRSLIHEEIAEWEAAQHRVSWHSAMKRHFSALHYYAIDYQVGRLEFKHWTGLKGEIGFIRASNSFSNTGHDFIDALGASEDYSTGFEDNTDFLTAPWSTPSE